MKNCHHEQRLYLVNNIDIIKGVFENWSNIAIIPTVCKPECGMDGRWWTLLTRLKKC
jgi:hypothetical protein